MAKHFPGHGGQIADSHKTLPVIRKDINHLDSIDLHPFKDYIDAGLSGIMVGHLAVPNIDSTGVPAAMSRVVIEDLLRKKMKFKGLVLTDALNMGGASGYDSENALMAGADIVIGPKDLRGEMGKVIKGVRNGRIPLEKINEKCRRILFYKFLTGYRWENEKGDGALHELIRSEAREIQNRLNNSI